MDHSLFKIHQKVDAWLRDVQRIWHDPFEDLVMTFSAAILAFASFVILVGTATLVLVTTISRINGELDEITSLLATTIAIIVAPTMLFVLSLLSVFASMIISVIWIIARRPLRWLLFRQ